MGKRVIKAYKLVKLRQDGSIGSLFINSSKKLPLNKWLKAKLHPTNGFAVRKGWHCTLTNRAPHLSKNGRIWMEVLCKEYELFDRPRSQGGAWLLAQEIMFVKPANSKNKVNG